MNVKTVNVLILWILVIGGLVVNEGKIQYKKGMFFNFLINYLQPVKYCFLHYLKIITIIIFANINTYRSTKYNILIERIN
jgi:hypothetical protein